MQNYTVTLKITDCCSNKCKTNTNTTTEVISSPTQFISIQNGYTFRISNVNSNVVILSISNGYIYIIRKGYLNIPQYINLGNNCLEHILTIEITNIQIAGI